MPPASRSRPIAGPPRHIRDWIPGVRRETKLRAPITLDVCCENQKAFRFLWDRGSWEPKLHTRDEKSGVQLAVICLPWQNSSPYPTLLHPARVLPAQTTCYEVWGAWRLGCGGSEVRGDWGAGGLRCRQGPAPLHQAGKRGLSCGAAAFMRAAGAAGGRAGIRTVPPVSPLQDQSTFPQPAAPDDGQE